MFVEGFEYIIKVNTSEGKHFKDLEEKRRKEMFCIEINQIIENNPEKIFYNYKEDDMKCKDYTNKMFP